MPKRVILVLVYSLIHQTVNLPLHGVDVCRVRCAGLRASARFRKGSSEHERCQATSFASSGTMSVV
jgi:hypothetical protein